jgi:hypothetical protein
MHRHLSARSEFGQQRHHAVPPIMSCHRWWCISYPWRQPDAEHRGADRTAVLDPGHNPAQAWPRRCKRRRQAQERRRPHGDGDHRRVTAATPSPACTNPFARIEDDPVRFKYPKCGVSQGAVHGALLRCFAKASGYGGWLLGRISMKHSRNRESAAKARWIGQQTRMFKPCSWANKLSFKA